MLFLFVFMIIDNSFLFSFDVAAWIKNNVSESEKSKAAPSGPGLKIAGTDGKAKEDEGIGVMLAMDKDEAIQRQERDAQAEIKRQQNALPSWHLKSTITGDLTALGIKESTRETVGTPNGVQQVSNDNILKGLGVVGGGPLRVSAAQAASRVGMTSVSSQEDVKPTINVESDRVYFQSFLFIYLFLCLIQSTTSIMPRLQLLHPLHHLGSPRLPQQRWVPQPPVLRTSLFSILN